VVKSMNCSAEPRRARAIVERRRGGELLRAPLGLPGDSGPRRSRHRCARTGSSGPQRPLHTGARPNQTAPDVARLRRHYGRDAQRRVALQYWSMEYFWVHMIQHVTVMLAAPALYVAGAPAIPLTFALAVATRRRLLRWVFLRPGRPLLRRIGAVVFSPLSPSSSSTR